MDPNSKQQNRRDDILTSLNAAIEAMNIAKEVVSMTPAEAVFGSAGILLAMIRDSMANETDYVELGLACADVCKALQQGMNGRRPDDLSDSEREAMTQLTAIVMEIRERVAEKGGQSTPSKLVHAKNDKDLIATWGFDLNRVLQVFTAEPVINTHTMVLDLHRNALTGQEGTGRQRHSTHAKSAVSDTMEPTDSLPYNTPPGESPPPPPRTCFGRDELIEKIVGLAENHTPLALIGAGGIGKTSIALTVLHHDRIKQRFGDNRRFIRCDQFPASRIHLLSQLSKIIGAGISNPESLTPMRPFLSSREMIVILDNAESILDPQGPNAQEIYAVVEEPSQLNNIWLCITSRISTIPPGCKALIIPTLPKEAAHDAFYQIYKNDEPSDLVDNILERLNFHPLSITLLATATCCNKWDTSRLSKEWERQWTGVLQTGHNTSLAATIELFLASQTFRELGPDARGLLEVVAFFPQGVNENNIDWLFSAKRMFSWLFPTTPNRKHIFDKFCILSLTYRSNGFITMLAPLRDHLSPKDPASHRFLRMTKKRYFDRLSVNIQPKNPGFKEASWITSEDVNVEHLLDVFTTIGAGSNNAWDSCCYFLEHLYWHKTRLVVLGPKIEALPDTHPSKPKCLYKLAKLYSSIGNHAECKRLLIHTLKLWRDRRNDQSIADTLRLLSIANRQLGLLKDGMEQAKEATEIFKRLNNISGQGSSLLDLASLLYRDNQLDAAEETTSQVIGLLSNKGEQFMICHCLHLLGHIYSSKGEAKKALDHFESSLAIASPFNWPSEQVWNHYHVAKLFLGKGRFDDAHVRVGRAKSHAISNPYNLGCTMELQARIWYKQCRFEEAKSEALCAIDVYNKVGAMKGVEGCRAILRDIERQ